jgi:WD40 repeat protein/ankyrin repeat protein
VSMRTSTASPTWTALHEAARTGNIEAVESLLERGATVDAVETGDQRTPLHVAAVAGHDKIVQSLLEKNANSAATDALGYTALHLSVLHGHTQVVECLLAHSKDALDTKDNTDGTPLLYATIHNNWEMVQLLCAAGADPHLPDEEKPSPLHIILQTSESSDLTHTVFEAALNVIGNLQLSKIVTIQDNAGNNPMHLALRNHPVAIQNTLVQHISSLSNAADCYKQANGNGQTPRDLLPRVHEASSSTAHAASSSSSTPAASSSSPLSFPSGSQHNYPPLPAQAQLSSEETTAIRIHYLVGCLYQSYQQQNNTDNPTLEAIQNYYVEQQYSLDPTGENPASMLEYIKAWLQNPEKPALLVLGEAGGGKSLLMHYWEQYLWNRLEPQWHFVPDRIARGDYMRKQTTTCAILYHQDQWWLTYQTNSEIEIISIGNLAPYAFTQQLHKQSYLSLQMDGKLREQIAQDVLCYWLCKKKLFLPIRIALGEHNETNARKCGASYLKTTLSRTATEFKKSDLVTLLENIKFLYLLDAYDEIKCANGLFKQNLYRSNKLSLYTETAKVLFTCRSQYFDSIGLSNQYFNTVKHSVSHKVYLTQFKLADIQAYIELYAHTNRLPNKAEIQANLTENTPLSDLLATPLLLKLYVQSYAPGEQPPQNSWAIYQRLMSRLFKRQAEKHHERQPNCTDNLEALTSDYEEASIVLAFELFLQNQDVLTRVRRSNWLTQQPENSEKMSLLEHFFADKNVILTELRRGHPFKRTPKGHYGFIHESFKEFFIAKQLLADLVQSSELTPSQVAHTWNAILLPEKPVILRFLKEAITTEAHAHATSLLNEWIRLKDPENAKISANAASLLTHLGQSFSNQDLSGTYLMGANLSGGMFDSTNFTEADCSGVNFSQAWLRNANFTKANLSDTEWGEYPKLELRGTVKAMYSDATGIIQIATVDGNKIYHWNGVTGEKLATLKGTTGIVSCLSYSRDGTQLASGNSDSTIGLWNLARQCEEASLRGHTSSVWCLSYSRDGTQLASGSCDSTIRLWNLARRCEEASLRGHTGGILCLSYSRDGTQLASGSKDRTIRLWNLARRCEEASLRGHTAWVRCLSYSRDSAQLASGSDDRTIRLWNLAQRCEEASLRGHTGFVWCLSYSQDGLQLASGSKNSTIRLWNLARQSQEASLIEHTGSIMCLSYSQDGAQLASGSEDSTVRLWNLARRCEVASLKGHTGRVLCLSYNRDGTQLASGNDDRTIRLWNLARRSQEASLVGHTARAWCLSYSRDGTQLASGSDDRTIRLWNLARRSQEASLVGHTSWIRCLSYSPDGAQLASGCYDNTIRLWNLARRSQEASLSGHKGVVWCMSYSPDGAQLASGDRGGTIRLWNLARRSQEALVGHTGNVFCLSYSRDGAQLASGSKDSTIRLWNLARRSQMASFVGHTGSVFCLSYSRDGTQLASGSKDKTLRIWDPVNSVCLRVLSLHLPIRALAWHEEFLALGCGKEIVHLRAPQDSKPEDWCVEWRAVRSRGLICNDLKLSGAICDSIAKRLLTQYGAVDDSDDSLIAATPEASSSAAAPNTLFNPDANNQDSSSNEDVLPHYLFS